MLAYVNIFFCFPRTTSFMSFTKLVILPCHSIWQPGPSVGEDKREWTLAGFQHDGQDHFCFKEHVLRSLSILETEPQSYLIISGGQTKRECGPVSELYSYYQLAQCMRQGDDALFDRITTEEFARDSFENVIFLICRFFEIHGYYPVQVCVVGFEFKRARFVELHLKAALRFAAANVEYIGNDLKPTAMSDGERDYYYKDLAASEAKYAYEPFSRDLYGLKPPLSAKRELRNPFSRFHGYADSNPALHDFMEGLVTHLPQDPSEALSPNMPWM